MDQCRCARSQRLFADLVPQAREIVEVALDLDLGAAHPRGADDAAHRRRQVELVDHRLQLATVGAVRNLAADPAAVHRVRHQHAIAAGERQIGGERGALVAAFFLDDLHQHHLATADDVLDLVAATQRHAVFTAVFLVVPATAAALAAVATALAAAPAAIAAAVPSLFAAFSGFAVAIVLGVVLLFVVAVFADGFGRRRLVAIVVVMILDVGDIALELVEVVLGALRRGSGMLGFLAEQRFAVFLRNLVIVGVDFAEGQEAVAIAAIFDECRLQGRFDAGNLGQIDIALELFVLGGLEIKLLDAVSLGDGDPGLFPVPRVDQHARGH